MTFLRYAGEGDGGLFEKTLRAEISLELHMRYSRRIDVNEYDISHPCCFEFNVITSENIESCFEESSTMLENGVPIYPIDNEPRIRRLKNVGNKIFGVKRGMRTMNLIERWLSRYGG